MNTVYLNSRFPGCVPMTWTMRLCFCATRTWPKWFSLLEQQRFMAVVGASGSGKSSLVRAGLLPAIRDGFVAVDSDPSDDVGAL